MADVVGAGVNAAKKSFLTVGLPMLAGAFFVAVIAAIMASRS